MSATRDGIIAGSVAGALSGIPSTAYALVTGRDPLAATVAAGSMLTGENASRTRMAIAAFPVHAALSLGWGIVLARVLPRRFALVWGAVAGLSIAAFDLGVVGPRFHLIGELDAGPQIADHLAFGLATGAMLSRRRERS